MHLAPNALDLATDLRDDETSRRATLARYRATPDDEVVGPMPHFRLHFQGHELDLGSAEFVVGRGDSCQFVIDDGQISRRHAAFRVEGDTLTVLDLNSRNGVKVNGARVDAPLQIKDGDTVLVGPHAFRVEVTDEPSRRLLRRALSTASQSTTSQNLLARAANDTDRWNVAERAFVRGARTDAERLVAEGLHHTLMAIQSGTLDGSALVRPTKFAIRLASEGGKALWIDWVFQAHHLADCVLPEAATEELLLVARKLRYPGSLLLRLYLEQLANKAARLNATERFTVQRTHGLLRTLMP